MPAKEQVKEIIESILEEILQRVVGEFSRRIRNCIVARWRLFEKKIDRCNKILKSQLFASFCFIYLPWILKKLQSYKNGTFFLYDPYISYPTNIFSRVMNPRIWELEPHWNSLPHPMCYAMVSIKEAFTVSIKFNR